MRDDVGRVRVRAASDVLRDYKLRRYLENRDKYENDRGSEPPEHRLEEKEKETI